MALTANSTIADIVAAYVDNSLYDVNNSPAQAQLFIQACRILLLKRPASINTDGIATRFNSGVIEKDLARATAFYAATASGRGRVRVGDISDIGRR